MSLTGPVSVILPAAGKGSRFRAGGVASASKIELPLAGRSIFLRAIDPFLEHGDVGQIILAVDPDRFDEFADRWGEPLSFMGVTLIPGGRADRWETVKLALDAVSADAQWIAVHDAARPLVSPSLIRRLFEAVQDDPEAAGAVPGLMVTDTLKRIDAHPQAQATASDVAASRIDDILGLGSAPTQTPGPTADHPTLGHLAGSVDRAGLFAVQTPQVFRADILHRAYQDLNATSAEGITDDASLVARLGHTPPRVLAVEGDPINLKITRPADAELAEAWLNQREAASSASAVKDLFGDDDDEL